MANADEVWFLVNPRSGGGAGRRLFQRLRTHFDSNVVYDLCDMDLETCLAAAQKQQARLAVCGGDGSIASVLDCIYVNNLDMAPAIIPLGTGNDLARVLGWMGMQAASPQAIRTAVAQARIQQLDRMHVRGPGVDRSWYNYCSVGSDAQIARKFDQMRKRYPRLFRHVWCNKAVYALITAAELGQRLGRKAPKVVHTQWDWQAAAALLFLNIPSYAGGLRLSPRINLADGLIDCLALPHLTALASMIPERRSLRVYRQQAAFELDLPQAVTMQCDGEAFLAERGRYELRCVGQVALLARA